MENSTAINLTKAILAASGLAALLLITIILPAEYNIDPTGIGGKIGVTVFNNDTSNISSVNTSSLQTDDANSEVQEKRHSTEIVVPAGRGVEYKFQMNQFAKLTYEWETDQGALYFDLHGEPEGDTTGYFESYAITTSPQMKGSFTAPFAGSHGWYWKNTNDHPVTVYLVTKGEFEVTGLKQ